MTESDEPSSKSSIFKDTIGKIGLLSSLWRSEKKELAKVEANARIASIQAKTLAKLLPAVFIASPRSLLQRDVVSRPSIPSVLGGIKESAQDFGDSFKWFSLGNIFKGLLLALPFLLNKDTLKNLFTYFKEIIKALGVSEDSIDRAGKLFLIGSAALTAALGYKVLKGPAETIGKLIKLAKAITAGIYLIGALALKDILTPPSKKPSGAPGTKAPSSKPTGKTEPKSKAPPVTGAQKVPSTSPTGAPVELGPVPVNKPMAAEPVSAPTPLTKEGRKLSKKKRKERSEQSRKDIARAEQSKTDKARIAQELSAKTSSLEEAAKAASKPATAATGIRALGSKLTGTATALGNFASKLLGPAAIAMQGYAAYEQFKDGDYAGAALSGGAALATTLGLLAAVGPGTQVVAGPLIAAGNILTAASLGKTIYDAAPGTNKSTASATDNMVLSSPMDISSEAALIYQSATTKPKAPSSTVIIDNSTKINNIVPDQSDYFPSVFSLGVGA